MQALAGARHDMCILSRAVLQAETRPASSYLQARALICYEGFPTRLNGWHCSNACTANVDEAVDPVLVVPACLVALRHRPPPNCDSQMALSGAKACCIPVHMVLSSKVSCITFHIKPMSIGLMLQMSLLLLLAAWCCA